MHIPKTTRRARTAAASVLLVVALGACGGEDPSPTSGDAAEDERSSATASPDSESSPAGEESPSEGAGPLDEKTLLPAMKSAIEDETSAHLEMTMDADGQSMDAKGDFAFQGKESDLAMTMSGAGLGGTMEIRVVDGVMYLSMPPMTPAGKFVRVDPDDRSNPFAGLVGQLQMDPRDTFGAFEAGLEEVTYVGEEPVEGETFDHYRLNVDFQAAARAQGTEIPPGTKGIPKTVDYDMWLDDDDLMRKVTFEMPQGAMEMTMSGWSEPVTVQAPPAKEIVKPGRSS